MSISEHLRANPDLKHPPGIYVLCSYGACLDPDVAELGTDDCDGDGDRDDAEQHDQRRNEPTPASPTATPDSHQRRYPSFVHESILCCSASI